MINIDRRQFLKGLGGVCAVAGLGAAGSAADLVLKGVSGAEASTAPKQTAAAVRWGMIIDASRFDEAMIDRCAKACHTLHNVPRFDSIKDELKWIWGENYENAIPGAQLQFPHDTIEGRKVAVLCNHCANPPCVRVCPTKATFKRADGVVMMDFHRCIGCRFCMAGCPYGSRSFNWRNPRINETTLVGGARINIEFPTRERGVVEKCNFCAERIDKGPMPGRGQELPQDRTPVCVLAAEGAMAFGNLNDPDSRIRMLLKAHQTIQRKPELGTNPSVFYKV